MDVDPFCRAAVLLNAGLNGVGVPFRRRAPRLPLPDVDVVLAGDVFYERALAAGPPRGSARSPRAGRSSSPATRGGPTPARRGSWRSRRTTCRRRSRSRTRRSAGRACSASGPPAERAGPPVALVCGNATLDRLGGALVPAGRSSTPPTRSRRSAPGCACSRRRGRTSRRTRSARPRRLPPRAIGARVVPAPATTVFENVYGPGGRRTQRVLSAAPPLDPASVPAAWRDAGPRSSSRPCSGEIEPAAFVRTVRAPPRRAVRPGARPRRPRRRRGRAAPLGARARRARRDRGAVLGEDEAAGQPDLVARLAAAVPIVAFTHGARGCEVLVAGPRDAARRRPPGEARSTRPARGRLRGRVPARARPRRRSRGRRPARRGRRVDRRGGARRRGAPARRRGLGPGGARAGRLTRGRRRAATPAAADAEATARRHPA